MSDHDNWDQHWQRYADAASKNPAQQMRHNVVDRLLRRSVPKPRRVLDLGSGQGDLLVRVHRSLPEAELVGFELSASGVVLSREKLPSARFVAADLFQPPPELNAFEGWATDAVCSEVLEHLDSPTDFLRAIRRYLADGAQLIVTVPGGPMSAFDCHIGHRRHFSADTLAAELRSAGFTVECVRRCGFPFFNLYRLVVIARGRRLASDVEAGALRSSTRVADAAMSVFRLLFRFNLPDFAFGWQLVAVARKSSPAER